MNLIQRAGERPLFMKQTLAVLILCFRLSPEAKAETSVNVTLTSDYVARGISQTRSRPALQGGLEWKTDTGLFAGLWGSNVDFGGRERLELGFFLGYDLTFENQVHTRLSLGNYFYFPRTGIDNLEFISLFQYRWAGVSYAFYPNWSGIANIAGALVFFGEHRFSSYSLKIEMARNHFQFGTQDYWDWGASISRTILRFTASVKVTAVDRSQFGSLDETRIIFSLSYF